jgi:glycosyltransferase involved in cell wall biosynthesis
MSSQPRPLSVGWKVHSLAANMASVRYRALLPVVALEPAGVRSRVFRTGLEANLDGLDVLVIVKSFTPEDLLLAQLAAARGIRVLLDLCDNIFIGDYAARSNTVAPAHIFLAMAEVATAIVVTTEPLAEVIHARVPGANVVVIPDGIETGDVSRQIHQVLREAVASEKAQRLQLLQQRVRNGLRRVRLEGVRVLPSLAGYVIRRVARALLRRLDRWTRDGEHRVMRRGTRHEEQVPQRRSAKKIVWFGNHGAEHARFGMLDILDFRGALEAVAKEHDVELVVISNDRRKYEANIAPLAIPSRYLEWSQRTVERWLDEAAVVIVPNSLDPFSLCKSANRTVLALAHGSPVVATATPALEPLADFISTGDPLSALLEILADVEQARVRARQGYKRAEALFGLAALREQWFALLRDLPAAQKTVQRAPDPWLVVVLHLMQDLDLALPILRRARNHGVSYEAWCSAALVAKSPRVFVTLRQEGIPFRILPTAQALNDFRFAPATRVLLTVAETNLGPHRLPRALTEAAKRQGLFVATLQHGFENVGLTYDDSLQSLDKVDIAAERIYIWGPKHTLHPRIREDVRARCVPVGCPKDPSVPAADLKGLLPEGRPIVGIFENLHWHRYSDAYRQAFLANVTAMAGEFPHAVFLVKPHHAGLWLTRRYEGERPEADNLVVADPQDPAWERHTASALMPHLAAVITSPSTVALDAARLGLPVAVVAAGLDLDNYRPLMLLDTREDWRVFVAQALDAGGRTALKQQSSQFVAAVLTAGDAADRILEDLRETAGA